MNKNIVTKQDLVDLKKARINLGKKIVRLIIKYTGSQKELWQRIPYLALLADSREDGDDILSRAYKKGYWCIYSRVHDQTSRWELAVDCATGQFMHPFVSPRNACPWMPIKNFDIIETLEHLERLDAGLIIKQLRARAKKLLKNDAAWRENIIERYKLTRIFQRDDENIEKQYWADIKRRQDARWRKFWKGVHAKVNEDTKYMRAVIFKTEKEIQRQKEDE